MGFRYSLFLKGNDEKERLTFRCLLKLIPKWTVRMRTGNPSTKLYSILSSAEDLFLVPPQKQLWAECSREHSLPQLSWLRKKKIILAGDEGSRKRRHMAPTESPRAVMVNLLEWPLIQTAGGSTHGFAPSGLDRS